MTQRRFWFGVLSAITLDVGLALLVTRVFLNISGRGLGLFESAMYYLVAIAITLTPDAIDLGLKGRHIGGAHHSLPTHWPIVAVLLALSLLQVSFFWGSVVGTILLLHYVHDSAQRGTGIEWLAPWSRRRYTLFDRCRQSPGEPLRAVYSIPTWELPSRDMPTTQWLERYYLRWTPESVTGLVVLIAALLTIVFWT